jgi:hypothetical protein
LHGDIVIFQSYRGCGAFVVYEQEVCSIAFYFFSSLFPLMSLIPSRSHRQDDLLLIKTVGECGYMIPPYFADAPPAYFQCLGMEDRHRSFEC